MTFPVKHLTGKIVEQGFCKLAVFALIATSSILLIGVPVVFASPDGWSVTNVNN